MQNRDSCQRIGLLAGAGGIPVYFARKASANGIRLVSIAFSDEIDAGLKPYVEKHFSIGIGRMNKILRTLKQENIQDLLMLGKVEKSVVLKPQFFDTSVLKILKRLATHEDKSLLDWVIAEFEKAGITVLDQKDFLKELFPQKGVLTRRKPSKQEMQDIEFGFHIAKKLADMEIGQTLIVKNKTVVATEAAEGTDQAIQRGCELAGSKCAAIKVSRTNQDYRWDIPGVGKKTVELLIQGKASVLAIEAGRVMIMDLPEVLKTADKAGLSIVAV